MSPPVLNLIVTTQNRTSNFADIFRYARLWLRLRLLCDPRDKGIEFGRSQWWSPPFVIPFCE